jgi:hypothetical protein
VSLLPDWLTGYDRENFDKGIAADKANAQIEQELADQGKIGSLALKQAQSHYAADLAENPDAEITGAFNDQLASETKTVADFGGGFINAGVKGILGSVPPQVWIAVALYVAWRLGLFKSVTR